MEHAKCVVFRHSDFFMNFLSKEPPPIQESQAGSAVAKSLSDTKRSQPPEPRDAAVVQASVADRWGRH